MYPEEENRLLTAHTASGSYSARIPTANVDICKYWNKTNSNNH